MNARQTTVRHICFNLHLQLSNWGALMLETAIVLIVGFALGYGVREWVSRRRRQVERKRRGVWGQPSGVAASLSGPPG